MTIFNVTVKYASKKFENVQFDTSQQVSDFRAILFSLSNVAPENQKIMCKGKQIKDGVDLDKLGLKDGIVITLMGTAGEITQIAEPVKPVVFMEDMSEEQIAKALKIPAGLVNLGNTCYMNATIQCLRAIPELKNAIELSSPGSFGLNPAANLAKSLKKLLDDLDNSGESIPPLVFLQLLRQLFPQFAERNNHGYMQQDAEECWGQIISSLRDIEGLDVQGGRAEGKKFIDQYMGIEVLNTMTCDEGNEPLTVSTESMNKLQVPIGPGVQTYMYADIQAMLTQKIEKMSESLGRSAMYTKVGKFSRLPKYLAINFVRFQWKAAERVRAKILKKVKFPMELDLTLLATPELLEKYQPLKNKFKQIDDERAAKLKQKKLQVEKEGASSSGDGATAMEVEKKSQMQYYTELGVDEALRNEVGASKSGIYELIAVLTHVGRAADSGHYIGWSKLAGKWYKFDDEVVSEINESEIGKLEGGGDWHSAYICLYKEREVTEI
ncbi:hypothetical protein HK098_002421 [Nowakowskiella sp. JEL0407]|nr:hypothetical protein HK098_002421 [Nowakowskiella sp. JEL0407]